MMWLSCRVDGVETMRVVAGLCFMGVAVFGVLDVILYGGLAETIVGIALICVGVGGGTIFFVTAYRNARAKEQSNSTK